MENLKLSIKNNKKDIIKFKIKNLEISKDFLMIAGPCSVEDEEQIIQTAIGVKKFGANMLRGGVFKPRTSPYSFQGIGKKGLIFLKNASIETGLPILTEVLDTRDVETVCEYADILQIGSRNMQNFSLLQEVGRSKKPVLLKRGRSATIAEWLCAAEYIMNEGNLNLILCERGIRTPETYTRNTLDVSAISAIKNISRLPIIADPSHATGRPELILPMCESCIMAGADGLMLEVHISPKNSLCDAKQAISVSKFGKIMQKINQVYNFKKQLEE